MEDSSCPNDYFGAIQASLNNEAVQQFFAHQMVEVSRSVVTASFISQLPSSLNPSNYFSAIRRNVELENKNTQLEQNYKSAFERSLKNEKELEDCIYEKDICEKGKKDAKKDVKNERIKRKEAEKENKELKEYIEKYTGSVEAVTDLFKNIFQWLSNAIQTGTKVLLNAFIRSIGWIWDHLQQIIMGGVVTASTIYATLKHILRFVAKMCEMILKATKWSYRKYVERQEKKKDKDIDEIARRIAERNRQANN